MPDPEIAELVDTDMDKAFEMAYKIFQMRYGLEETGWSKFTYQIIYF